ncbi:uncharacterized protein LOC135153949 [Lytechinus pictus]|uniref:uncharacterized protein LOC135153949 n=1 Tax=Lytechinus pictus TaxID=7653 RepID=UPI0030B9F1B2
MKDDLCSVDWDNTLKDKCCTETWTVILDMLHSLMEKYIPKASNKKQKKRSIYMTKDALILQKRKSHLWDKYRKSRSRYYYDRYREVSNELRSLTRQLRKDHEDDLISNIGSNPKGFWNYASHKKKARVGIGDLNNDDGSPIHSDQGKAEALNTYFASVFTSENVNYLPDLTGINHGEAVIKEVTVNPDIVEKKLRNLNGNKSAGPDNIHPRFIKELARELAEPMSVLSNRSLEEAKLPEDWKARNVTPIHKKGSRKAMENYRPVTLASVDGKQLESIIRDAVMKFLERNNLLSDCQHGFVNGRSCMTQLLLVIEEWTRILDDSQPIDVLYLGF